MLCPKLIYTFNAVQIKIPSGFFLIRVRQDDYKVYLEEKQEKKKLEKHKTKTKKANLTRY